MLQLSDLYSQNYRAVRYGILFVAITFVCFFASEHLVRGMRLHPTQYLITAYISGATNNRPAAAGIGVALATSYGLLYVILLSQD
jgi:inner membrane protein involved in colicin E2 resistance